MPSGTALRHYDVIGRYYDSRTHASEDNLGKTRAEARFSLRVIASKDSQQSLNPPGNLMLRLGYAPTDGGYAVFSDRQCEDFFKLLVTLPDPDDEIVRDSVRAEGTYVDPWQPSANTLSYSDNTLKRMQVYLEPIHSSDNTGLRVQLDGTTTNTPYIDLTPAQYRDLVHAVNEYLDVKPDYRTVQQITPETVPVSGIDTTPERPPPDCIGKQVSTNVLEFQESSTTSTSKQARI